MTTDHTTLNFINMNSMEIMHFLITKRGYKPVVLHGTKDEVWLENFHDHYQLVRICLKEIRNQEQYHQDLGFVERISKRISKSTLSFGINVLNIYLYNHFEAAEHKRIKSIVLDYTRRIEVNDLLAYFKDFEIDYSIAENDFERYMHYAEEINQQNKKNAEMSEEIFKAKTPYVTYGIILVNLLMFLLTEVMGGSTYIPILVRFGALYRPLIKGGEYYRLLTPVFLHGGITHFMFNNYAIYVIGKQIETFYGHTRYFVIYFFSAIISHLLVFLFVPDVSVGSSSAIFGLFSAYIYFGYHNRVILGRMLKEAIIPILAINLVIGMLVPSINNVAHVGSLLGGFFISMSVGVRFKTKWYDQLAAIASSIALIVGLFYIGVFVKPMYSDEIIDHAMVAYYYSINDYDAIIDYEQALRLCEERNR